VFALAGLNSCGSQSTHLAYVTTGTNGILAFRIHNTSGAATNIVTSPFLVGDTTFGMVIHPSNNFALVANQHSGTISRLDIDLTSGALTEKLPRTPAGISPGPMILDSSGNFLFVADRRLNQILRFQSARMSLVTGFECLVGSAPPL
jgi:6-phosphogluconolactonase (cycloisomerase 2 family)